MKKIFFTLFIVSISIIVYSQQKFGYLNSAEILSKVPGIALADSSLKKYQDTLTISIQEKIKVFQKHVADYQAEQQKGNLAPIAAQKKEEELQKEQENLRAFEEELKQKLAIRRDLLYSCLLYTSPCLLIPG